MRCVDCPCGLVLTGEDDEALYTLGRRHADEDHADQGISADFIRSASATTLGMPTRREWVEAK
jgi:hypothetical protein